MSVIGHIVCECVAWFERTGVTTPTARVDMILYEVSRVRENTYLLYFRASVAIAVAKPQSLSLSQWAHRSLPDCISQKDHTKKKLLGILLGFEANVTQQASVAKEAIVRNVAQATVDSDASDLEHTVSYYNKLGNYERFRHIRLANHRRCHRLSCFAYWEYRHHKR